VCSGRNILTKTGTFKKHIQIKTGTFKKHIQIITAIYSLLLLNFRCIGKSKSKIFKKSLLAYSII